MVCVCIKVDLSNDLADDDGSNSVFVILELKKNVLQRM